MPPSRPSITTWNRLEPRARASSVTDALNAEIRDAAWMLTRQWQFGEFDAEDAGSIAYAQLTARIAPLLGWRPAAPPDGGQPTAQPLTSRLPMEAAIQAEPFRADLATRVELGATFVALLHDELSGPPPPADLDGFRAAYPIRPVPEARPVMLVFTLDWNFDHDPPDAAGIVSARLRDAMHAHGIALAENSRIHATKPEGRWLILDGRTGQPYLAIRAAVRLQLHRAVIPDQATARFGNLCAGRAIDGAAIYQDATAASPPARLEALAPAGSAVRRAVDALRTWVEHVFGELGENGDPAAWQPERLQYGAEVLAATETDQLQILTAHPSHDGSYDWHSFDLTGTTPRPANLQDGQEATITPALLPNHVQFRGMPSPRWWEFEDATTYLGTITPDSRDLARLIVQDFVLIYGNDWFSFPFPQPLGSMCTVETLIAHDVFGGTTEINRASAVSGSQGRWTMYATTKKDAGPGEAATAALVLPLSAATSVETGPALEEVQFLRDEMANLVWAVEHTTENGLGEPWPGHERDLAVRAPAATPPAPAAKATSPTSAAPSLHYHLQSSTAEHWIPLLPVAVDPVRQRIGLMRGVTLRATGGLTEPAGRLLESPHPIWEEEVPRSGIEISRNVCRARWVNGETHIWIMRHKKLNAGEASSGLRFDQVIAEDRTT